MFTVLQTPFNLFVPPLLNMLAKIAYQISDTVIMRPQVPGSQFYILNKPSDRREGKTESEKKSWPEKKNLCFKIVNYTKTQHFSFKQKNKLDP